MSTTFTLSGPAGTGKSEMVHRAAAQRALAVGHPVPVIEISVGSGESINREPTVQELFRAELSLLAAQAEAASLNAHVGGQDDWTIITGNDPVLRPVSALTVKDIGERAFLNPDA